MSRIVFGVRPIEELCRARPREVAVVYVADGYRSKEIETAVAVAKDRGITVEFRPRALVAQLASSPNHQGMVAVAGEYQYARVDEMLAAAAVGEAPLLLVLDCITDPQNFGALVRSAEVLGSHGVIVPDKHAAPVTGAVVKASAGASERMRIARVHNLLGTIDWLREQGIAVWGGTADESATSLAEADLRGPCALVIGGEGRGLRTAVARRCSALAQIPQRGHVASLNASVAGAILLYEAVRQRAMGSR
jgi:23S rRNA (guanosine2251-2'-O)-methyltransferase